MKKLPIILIIIVGVVVLSIITLIPKQEIEQAEIINVFDLNYCPNQNKIVGEMWFLREKLKTIPVRATINYEINNLGNLVEEGRIKITPEDFRIWKIFGTEMYAYDFEIPVQSNVTDKNLIFIAMLDGGGSLVYENTIKRLTSLDNCKWS